MKKYLCSLMLLLMIGPVWAMGEKPKTRATPVTDKAAYDFTLKDLQGKTVKLSDQKGKVVFLNFWASWCPPCREEMPSIERLHRRLDGKDFIILAVSLDQGDIHQFVKEGKYSFRILLDPEGRVGREYGVTGIPTTFIIDKKGIIRQKAVGSRDWSGFNP